MFYPGETVVHEFTIPFTCISNDNEPVVSKVIVTYKQNDRTVLIIPVTSFTSIEEDTKSLFTVNLSQQQSLMFSEKDVYTIQLNVYLSNGTRAACDEFKSITGVQHYKEVITNG